MSYPTIKVYFDHKNYSVVISNLVEAFQFEVQHSSSEEVQRLKQDLTSIAYSLKDGVKPNRVSFKLHEAEMHFVRGVTAQKIREIMWSVFTQKARTESNTRATYNEIRECIAVCANHIGNLKYGNRRKEEHPHPGNVLQNKAVLWTIVDGQKMFMDDQGGLYHAETNAREHHAIPNVSGR